MKLADGAEARRPQLGRQNPEKHSWEVSGENRALWRLLKKPQGAARAIAIEVEPSEAFGVGRVTLNPFVESLPSPISETDAAELTVRGVPLSLAAALKDTSLSASSADIVSYLHELVLVSQEARLQLVEHGEIPLYCTSGGELGKTKNGDLGKPAKVLLEEVNSLCKREWAPRGSGTWGGYGVTNYTVWCGDARIELPGVVANAGALEFNGTTLTGGRLWTSALLLLAWVARVSPPGVLLELGAGLGAAGLLLARSGRRVVLTEREPALLRALETAVAANGLQDNCRVLALDWADLPTGTARALARTGVKTLIGADLVYTPEASRALAHVVARVLPPGGKGYFIFPGRHRPHSGGFASAVEAKGLHVEQFTIPMTEAVRVLHGILATTEERDQVFHAYIVSKAETTANPPEIANSISSHE